MLNPSDLRLKKNQEKQKAREEKRKKAQAPRHVEQTPSALFFKYNEQLGPPYHVIVDTNFINFSIKNKLEIVQAMMDW